MLYVSDFNGPVEINNYGGHHNIQLNPERQKDASDEDLKYILFWNEAYGSKVQFICLCIVLYWVEFHLKEYDLGFGRQPFYDNFCPETRCFATDDR